jgi:hypothetical protein
VSCIYLVFYCLGDVDVAKCCVLCCEMANCDDYESIVAGAVLSSVARMPEIHKQPILIS